MCKQEMADNANGVAVPDWQLGLDPRCRGRDDPRCVWEVYDTDDMGRRERAVACFGTLAAALAYLGGRPMGYRGVRQIRVFASANEVREAETEERRRAALAKLTVAERQLLGVALPDTAANV